MPYPPGWQRVKADSGAASAARFDTHGHYLGYLNVTPQQGDETLANWDRFRVQHNADEGDRQVKTIAAGTGLRFLTGTGSCVKDTYVTITHARYVEIACLVAGHRATSVIVGAAPPSAWAQTGPLIERAISAFRT